MNKKTKKIVSLVLGVTLAGTAFTGCMGSKSSCSGMDKKSSCSGMDKKAKKASCGSSGCGSN